MNQSQRTFLLDRVKKKAREATKVLEKQMKSEPDMKNHVFMAIMNGTLKMRTSKEIFESLKKRALDSDQSNNWLMMKSRGYYNDKEDPTVVLECSDLFQLPESYAVEKKKADEHNAALQQQINAIDLHMESLEVRITLASDKTLQQMINEVDDMGNLSLIDTKIKLLSA
jgi:hypothetical protein